ncbi:hypothetical protein VTK73DRAFT_2495 [Phialemonium thermophilum]|uniref:DNA (cytosine-5-)-methyltransferase n=1 Tax=Phialemonium thermophilum TaxID=223376 RepID=A0ABR3Y2H0_9PEZI
MRKGRKPLFRPFQSQIQGNTVDFTQDDNDDILEIFSDDEDLVEVSFVDLTDDAEDVSCDTRSSRQETTGPSPQDVLQEAPAGVLGTHIEQSRLRLVNGQLVSPGSIVELRAPCGRFRIRFIKVRAILFYAPGTGLFLRGWAYTRTTNLKGMLPRKTNEVCLIGRVDERDPRPWEEQALVDVAADHVCRVRPAGLRSTNALFPQFRFSDEVYAEKGRQWVRDNAVLVCRYQYYLVYRDALRKRQDKSHEWVLQNNMEDQADNAYKIRDAAKMNHWRGGKVEGGSFHPSGLRRPVIELDVDETARHISSWENPQKTVPGQKYTAADIFCGAGGTSSGIEQAGFKLLFGVDNWPIASQTYRTNFPETVCHNMSVWSPAHTIPGRNDEDNMAALFACSDLIKKIRPRVFTMEQTFGILHDRFSAYFNSLIGGFTDHGYSVRWRTVHFNTWGLCQPRKRLLIIGACPGECLPDFPRATHSLTPCNGRRPFTTTLDALAPLRRRRRTHDPLHNPAGMKRLNPGCLPPWNPEQPLRRTITCSGGQNYHWSGTRNFTLREYAILQGFPLHHKFLGSRTNAIRQIGNAFPASIARRLFTHILHFLERVDGVSSGTMDQPIDLVRASFSIEEPHPRLLPVWNITSRRPTGFSRSEANRPSGPSVSYIDLQDWEEDRGNSSARNGDHSGENEHNKVVLMSPPSLKDSQLGSSPKSPIELESQTTSSCSSFEVLSDSSTIDDDEDDEEELIILEYRNGQRGYGWGSSTHCSQGSRSPTLDAWEIDQEGAMEDVTMEG